MWTKAIEAIKRSSPESAVYIGCDSVRSKVKGMNRWQAVYSSVIVLHHPRDGCNIFSHDVIEEDYGNIKTRMLNEVNHATQTALAVIDYLDGRRMEIHLDINTDPKYKSSVAVKEAIGWVRGMFMQDPILKPDAWAASYVGDHIARGKHKPLILQ
jgi:predicted RNase H-related nuclease YkuK (DUF458 family)